MNFTKKFDRAFQWAGEKMGQEARTTTTEEFRNLETEMALRFDGMVKLQTTMNSYVKWLTHRDNLVGEKGVPSSVLGRTMIAHGEDFDRDSQFGNCLIEMGRANDQVAQIQEQYAQDATRYWSDSVERSVAMMKEYQAARKKLESRRLALDASSAKMNKAKRDDFRLEEELRSAKAKYEEANEDVFRRMQDIKDAEADSVRDLTRFLDIELDYHERCAEVLRQKRAAWTAGDSTGSPTMDSYYGTSSRRPSGRSRSNTAQSLSRTISYTSQRHQEQPLDEYDEPEDMPAASQQMRVPIRSQSRVSIQSAASNRDRDRDRDTSPLPPSSRPTIARASTYHQAGASLARVPSAGAGVVPTPLSNGGGGGGSNIASLRGQLRPTAARPAAMDVFADEDGSSSDTPPGSTSPATSYASSSRTSLAGKKAPPPPPSRAKKPPPPVPNRREREA